ncbi:hypothetical protein BC830DRAFT_1169878 [Chytriomyces sp. MP71]|nr:hypothetical protein BC830DRAFT_1169878 [Chytriomyces sp. MP71]
MHRVSPFLAEFSAPNVPMQELATFYDTSGVDRGTLRDRPYTWTNSVSTLDGFMHFESTEAVRRAEQCTRASEKNTQEHGSIESDIALKNHPVAGKFSLADYRLLNAGWVFADAVLASGACVRVDPGLHHCPIFEDMLEHRKSVLGKPLNPINLVITASAAVFDYAHHALFNASDLYVVVITTETDRIAAETAYLASRSMDSASKLWEGQAPANAVGTVRFVSLSSAVSNIAEVHLPTALHFIKHELGVHFLEVDAGGSTIHRMIDLKLVDEMRWTQTGQLIGSRDAGGLHRPSLLGAEGMASYDAKTSVVFRTLGIRAIGDHHLFMRYALEYRH